MAVLPEKCHTFFLATLSIPYYMMQHKENNIISCPKGTNEDVQRRGCIIHSVQLGPVTPYQNLFKYGLATNNVVPKVRFFKNLVKTLFSDQNISLYV